MQAEKARVPYANVGLVKLPDDVPDDQAILLSDIFPTGYQAADTAQIRDGDVVCVFGCGPVGQFAIWSAKHLGAGRVIAVDAVDGPARRRSRAGRRDRELQIADVHDAISAYEEFDRRRPGWLKVALDPAAVAT